MAQIDEIGTRLTIRTLILGFGDRCTAIVRVGYIWYSQVNEKDLGALNREPGSFLVSVQIVIFINKDNLFNIMSLYLLFDLLSYLLVT